MTANVRSVRIRRALMPAVRAAAAEKQMTAAEYVAHLLEEIAEDHVVVQSQDQSLTRLAIAIEDTAWQKVVRIAALRNFRSVGDLIEARIEEG